MAFANPNLIAALMAMKNSFNFIHLTVWLKQVPKPVLKMWYILKINALRSSSFAKHSPKTCRRLVFTVLPSAANFVFATLPNHQAADLSQALRQEGVIVRHFNQPRIKDYLRISVGTQAQKSAID